MIKIFPIKAFQDNYIWTLFDHCNRQAVVVDPGDAAAVDAALKKNNLNLAAILVTHHHWDHTNGIEPLIHQYNVPVYGPHSDKISTISYKLVEDDTIFLKELNISFTILEVPGHTRDHIAYYGQKILFCGDTLFTGGCGKLFEGTAKEMLDSLTKLANLAQDTLVYCAHEYTLNNLRFAAQVEPNNAQLQSRLQQTITLRENQQITVPALLSVEKATNPFLRCHLPEVKLRAEEMSQTQLTSTVEVFAQIRKWKDNFSA